MVVQESISPSRRGGEWITSLMEPAGQVMKITDFKMKKGGMLKQKNQFMKNKKTDYFVQGKTSKAPMRNFKYKYFKCLWAMKTKIGIYSFP